MPGDADLWIKIWEEMHNLAAGEILVEVEHAKAHRTEKEKKEVSLCEKFVTERKPKSKEKWRRSGVLKPISVDA